MPALRVVAAAGACRGDADLACAWAFALAAAQRLVRYAGDARGGAVGGGAVRSAARGEAVAAAEHRCAAAELPRAGGLCGGEERGRGCLGAGGAHRGREGHATAAAVSSGRLGAVVAGVAAHGGAGRARGHGGVGAAAGTWRFPSSGAGDAVHLCAGSGDCRAQGRRSAHPAAFLAPHRAALPGVSAVRGVGAGAGSGRGCRGVPAAGVLWLANAGVSA